MRTTLIALVLLVASAAHAQNYQGYTLRPMIPTTQYTAPAYQPGTVVNPYQLQDRSGRVLGTYTSTLPPTPQYPQGSVQNPWMYQPTYGQRR